MIHNDDLKTAKRILAGDEAAFDRFYDAYYDRVFRFCVRRINNEDAAYDIVQQTLERAVKYLHSYRGEASMYTWLCQICRNEIASWFSKTGNDPNLHVSIEENPAIKAVLESERYGGSVDEQAQIEIAQLVHIAVDSLPDRYADVLEYKYLKGMSVEQISERIGISYLATESLLARARRSFKSLLNDLTAEHSFTAEPEKG